LKKLLFTITLFGILPFTVLVASMVPVNDWLNLKFEKQWQDWMTGDERCGVEWYTV